MHVRGQLLILLIIMNDCAQGVLFPCGAKYDQFDDDDDDESKLMHLDGSSTVQPHLL